jgi:hypothetical protein
MTAYCQPANKITSAFIGFISIHLLTLMSFVPFIFCIPKKDNEDADSAHAQQVRALYNRKSTEFHKILIIVLGLALFFFVVFLVPSMQQL